LSAAKFKASLLVLLGSVTLVWTFMTPFGGVADEPGYAIYANVVASGQGYDSAEVPAYIAALYGLSCFAFKPGITAHCQQEMNWKSLGQNLVQVGSEKTISGFPQLSSYPTPYFWVVGQPSRILSGFPAAYLMRLFSWGLGMSLIALMVLFWPRQHRSSLVIAALLASTPMVGSFVGAINPNGFEIVSGLSLSGLLTALMLNSGVTPRSLLRNSVHLTAIFIAMLALSVSKPWSFLFTFVITLAFLLASAVVSLREKGRDRITKGKGYRGPEFLWVLCMAGLSIVVGYASNGTYRNVMAERGTNRSVLSLWDASYVILNNFTGYTLELIGIFGWRDHSPPLFVVVLWASAIVAFVMYALRCLLIPYRILLLGFITGVLLVIPVLSYKALGLLGGAGFQARYLGAVFCAIPFIVVAYLHLSGTSLEELPAARLAPTLVGWFFVLQVGSLFWSFLRYSVGFPLPKPGTVWDFQWVPDYWVVTLIGLLVFAGSSIIVRRQLRDPATWSDPSERRSKSRLMTMFLRS
jgi:Predicted membrane protein (DUF2142)